MVSQHPTNFPHLSLSIFHLDFPFIGSPSTGGQQEKQGYILLCRIIVSPLISKVLSLHESVLITKHKEQKCFFSPPNRINN